MSAKKFFRQWGDSLSKHPFLILEIGYTRPTDYVLHVWNSEGVGIKDAPKVIMIQETNLKRLFVAGIEALRSLEEEEA